MAEMGRSIFVSSWPCGVRRRWMPVSDLTDQGANTPELPRAPRVRRRRTERPLIPSALPPKGGIEVCSQSLCDGDSG
jgi:hypothetical protein